MTYIFRVRPEGLRDLWDFEIEVKGPDLVIHTPHGDSCTCVVCYPLNRTRQVVVESEPEPPAPKRASWWRRLRGN